MNILSLGAGVQSTAMLLMALDGEFGEVPDIGIFADTGWEPPAVYRHLEWLEEHCRDRGFLLERVENGNIRDDAVAGGDEKFATMPFFVQGKKGRAMLRRQCTNEYKLRPIQRRIRELLKERGEKQATMWLGISRDEALRMRDSRVKYIRNYYPLVDAVLTRQSCLLWLEERGYPSPTRSACIGCPFRSDREWRMIREEEADWADLLDFDARIRTLPRIEGEVFLHRSLAPMESVDLSTLEDKGQLNMFEQECEGMCGV